MTDERSITDEPANLVLVYENPRWQREIVCSCGHVNAGPPRLHTAQGFCAACDRPLFYLDRRRPDHRVRRLRGYRRPHVRGVVSESPRACPTCGELNDVPPDAQKLSARCHRDHAPLYRNELPPAPPDADERPVVAVGPGAVSLHDSIDLADEQDDRPWWLERWIRVLIGVVVVDIVLLGAIVALIWLF